jgi:hypothetical protein
MRESQMKKIIAAAVATAFVAPTFAADVTLSGDVEYVLSNADGVTSGDIGDRDFNITATEEYNGMTITAALDWELAPLPDHDSENADDIRPASALSIAGSFGTLSVGDDVGSAVGSFDEITDKSEKGGDIDDAGGTLAQKNIGIKYALPTGIAGLNVHVGYEVGGSDDADSATTTDEDSTSAAIQYTMGSVTAFYGLDDGDDADTVTAYGIAYANGPIYVAYEAIDGLDGAKADEMTAIAVSYNYGNGALTYEAGEKTVSGTKTEKNAVSASYKIGPVNTYVSSADTGTDTDATTYVGVEYAF